MCAEVVKAAAVRCRFCGYDFTGMAPILPGPAQAPPPARAGSDGCSTSIGCILGLGIVLFLSAVIFGGGEDPAPASVAPGDVVTSEQRSGCTVALAGVTGSGALVEHRDGTARADGAWWGDMTRDEQLQVMNMIACADFGVRLPGIRGDDQIVAVYDSRSGATLGLASNGQRLK